ncbi:MAG: hypothetical protein JNJ45_09025 [Chthonomonas sp.]|nr:hypothetical protein [Chthonomonas sp.]
MNEIRLPPTGDAVCEYINSQVAQPAFLTALSPMRLKAFRDVLTGEFEFGVWTQLVDIALSMSLIVSPRVARPGEVEAALELAAHELADEDPSICWARLGGIHGAIRQMIEECHSHLLRVDDFQHEGASARMQRVARVWARAQQIIYEGKQEFLADRLEYVLDLEPMCIGHLGDIVVLPGLDESPRAELFFEWLTKGGTPIRVLRSDMAAGDHWVGNLFSTNHAPASVEFSEIRVADSFAEAEWCIREVNRHLAEGVMPHDVAIYLPQPNEQGALLQHAANSHGVPISWGPRAQLSTIPFAQFVLEMLDVLARRSLRGLIRLANWSYWGFSMEQRDIIAAWVRGELQQGHTSMDQIAVPPDDDLTIWFTMLRDWRTEALRESRTVRAWSRHLDELLKNERFIAAVAETDCPTNERDLRTRQALHRTIVDSASVRDREGTQLLTFRDFVALAGKLWEGGDVVLPGRTPGGVPVITNVDQMVSYSHVLILGARERSIPRPVSEDPILLDEDRAWLAETYPDRPRLPQMEDRVLAERQKFRLLCAAARKSICFIWPETIGSSRQVRSFFLAEIERVTGATWPTRRVGVTEYTPPRDECLSQMDAQLADLLAEEPTATVPSEVRELRNLLAIRPRLEKPIPLRALHTVQQCAFHATIRDLLEVKTPRETSPTVRLRYAPDSFSYVGIETADLANHFAQNLQQELTKLSWDMEPWTIQMVENTIETRASSLTQKLGFALDKLDFVPDETMSMDPISKIVTVRVPAGGQRFPVYLRIEGYGRIADGVENQIPTVFLVGTGIYQLKPEEPELAIAAAFALAGLQKKRGLVFVPTRSNGLELIKVGLEPKLRRNFPGKEVERLFGPAAEDDPEWFASALRESMEKLAQNRMQVQPGTYCRQCHFADLCRVNDLTDSEDADETD